MKAARDSFVQVVMYKFGSRNEDVEDHLNEFLELVRRCEPRTDPVPDQVKHACTISNTPEPLKTHFQVNVGRVGNLDALRVATEDYMRSRRIFTTTANVKHNDDPMEVDVLSLKWKMKCKFDKGKKGGKQGKENPLR